jgi:thiol-disulfide isomerase/thioredoxin
VLAGKKLVGLYFGAPWCGYCVRFSPLLEALYKQTAKDRLEIVYVSSCSSEEEHAAYTKHMPWPSVPFRDASTIGYIRKAIRDQTGQQQGRLATLYRVTGLPALIILDGADAAVLRSDGRPDMQNAARVGDAVDAWEAARGSGSGSGYSGGGGGGGGGGGRLWAAAGGVALAGVAAACLLRSRRAGDSRR